MCRQVLPSVVCCLSVNDITHFTFISVSFCTVHYVVTDTVSGFYDVANSKGVNIILRFVPPKFCASDIVLNTLRVVQE